ncbi:hypothetical protein LGN30_32115 [Burkholderia seminalis]|uniref:Rap1a/Tai family immunity protein n=1 Tax=Burkholderia seminalis TaxID=488731 RepID=UPI001CF36F5B|nr:Rap1a/Tai family immunity protein [Burkholderia seminalis]MCA8427835.1 hypothetical protein [Burkholderia seminalis]
MLTRLKFAGAAALLVSSIGAHAEITTGAKLQEWLSSNDGALHLAATMYIVGVLDDDGVLQAAEMKGLMKPDQAPRHLCASGKAKGPELQQSVARMLNERPELKRMPAVLAVRAALARDYPCT